MPLVIFTGLPCSGKTTWGKKLELQLQDRIEAARAEKSPGHEYSVIYHSDETLNINHDTYRDSNAEKLARGTQMSAVKRDLAKNKFVILDSLAYIKGFRYQLFCEAKGVVTPHCVIHVVNLLSLCLKWNQDSGSKWDGEVIEQLQMRYEEPNPDTRWDSPLFTIVSEDSNEQLPMDEIWDALVLKKAPPPNAATLVKATSGNDFLQELDRQTQSVIGAIVQYQQLNAVGGEVLIDKNDGIVVEMPATPVSIAQLQRIRRSFISLNRMRSVDVGRITAMFVDYVNRSLNNE